LARLGNPKPTASHDPADRLRDAHFENRAQGAKIDQSEEEGEEKEKFRMNVET
jgi:hypothetical protein